MPNQTETRYQCQHIQLSGLRCGSPALRNEPFCYHHHTTRRPASTKPIAHCGHHSEFDLLLPEDRSAIQHNIGLILQRIATNQIDPRRAGLLLYGLQIATANLRTAQKSKQPHLPPNPSGSLDEEPEQEGVPDQTNQFTNEQ